MYRAVLGFVTSDLTKLQSNKLNLPKPNSTKMNLTNPSKFDKFNKPKSTKLNKSKIDRFWLNWLDTWLTWLKNGFKNLRYSDWKDLRCLKVLRNFCTDPYLLYVVPMKHFWECFPPCLLSRSVFRVCTAVLTGRLYENFLSNRDMTCVRGMIYLRGIFHLVRLTAVRQAGLTQSSLARGRYSLLDY